MTLADKQPVAPAPPDENTSMKVMRGRRALVTGPAGGIGRAIALELARQGVNLCLLDIDEANLTDAANEARALGVEVNAQRCDLADPAQIDQAVDVLLADSPALHILVNNAGILYFGRLDRMTDAMWDRMLAVNLHAPLQLIRRLLPVLRQQDEAHILNVASTAGLVPIKRLAAYGATKHALVALTLALREEMRGTNMGVGALCPGFVPTALNDRARQSEMVTASLHPPRWMHVSPQRIARCAVKAIRRNRRLVTGGFWARLLWWMHRYLPGRLGSAAGSATMTMGQKPKEDQ